jgi:hypothetical protein
MTYFNSKNHKANHAMRGNEQYYDIIGIACVLVFTLNLYKNIKNTTSK